MTKYTETIYPEDTKNQYPQRLSKYICDRFFSNSPNEIPKILDIGCCTGKALKCFAENQKLDLYGIDLRDESIEGINFKECNLEKERIPFPDNYFDLNRKNILISNVTGKEVANSSLLKDLLIKQIESRVRWRESVILMINKGISKAVRYSGLGKVDVLFGFFFAIYLPYSPGTTSFIMPYGEGPFSGAIVFVKPPSLYAGRPLLIFSSAFLFPFNINAGTPK